MGTASDMEYNVRVYHGTQRSSGMQILSTRQFKASRGIEQWLGDGVYFWLHDLDAYWWIRVKWRRRVQSEKRDPVRFTLIENYCIITADIQTTRERVFDLTDPTHRMAFFDIMRQVKDRVARGKLSGNEVAETYVLNHMFKTLRFSEDYDVVLAMYPQHRKMYNDFETRLGYMPQWQVCVKNIPVATIVEEYPLHSKKAELERLYSLYISAV